MATRRVWFERHFPTGVPQDAFPDLVERLRGTPLRLEERTSGLAPTVLTRRPGERWSVQEHAGHLDDLERLWLGRLEDFAAGAEALRAADLQNRATWDAGHNERPLGDVLADFRARRRELLDRLAGMSPDGLAATALHPRLGQPMTVVDLCYFVAEHDDHHLAAITELRAELDGARGP